MIRVDVAAKVAAVRERIAEACARAGRDPAEVTLVAVSKTHPPEAVHEALAAGLTHFGENRIEEAQVKIPAVNAEAAPRPTWHMIGHIQSRKARAVPPLFDVIHAVDSVKLASKLNREMAEQSAPRDVLLEINISGEATKHGLKAYAWQSDPALREVLWQAVRAMLDQPQLRVRGLMTMAPYEAEPEACRPVFAQLAALRDRLEQDFQVSLPDLSMGMTNDYTVAIEEGATIVRIGRALFGERER